MRLWLTVKYHYSRISGYTSSSTGLAVSAALEVIATI
jgi:hypothetical protein